MVAPTASTVMAEILPYLGIEPSYSAEELLGMDTTVPNVIGSTVEQAKEKLKERALSYKIVGDGDTITDRRHRRRTADPVLRHHRQRVQRHPRAEPVHRRGHGGGRRYGHHRAAGRYVRDRLTTHFALQRAHGSLFCAFFLWYNR